MKLINGRTFSGVFLSAEGRLNNREYFLYNALGCITYLLLIQMLKYCEIFIPQYVLGLFTWGLLIFWIVCRIFLGIKRCHDLGHSGTWLFWYLCPIFNLVFPFMLYFEKGDKTENKYGKVPGVFSKNFKIITVFAVIIRRLWVGYLYYTVFSDIDSKLSEITQQVNQEVNMAIDYEISTDYEIATQDELLDEIGNIDKEELSKYRIPKIMLEKDSDLIDLILGSLSLEKMEDKQAWFDLYTVMDDVQIEKLRDILTREKDQLEEIEQKYLVDENSETSLSDDNLSGVVEF